MIGCLNSPRHGGSKREKTTSVRSHHYHPCLCFLPWTHFDKVPSPHDWSCLCSRLHHPSFFPFVFRLFVLLSLAAKQEMNDTPTQSKRESAPAQNLISTLNFSRYTPEPAPHKFCVMPNLLLHSLCHKKSYSLLLLLWFSHTPQMPSSYQINTITCFGRCGTCFVV